MFLCFCNFQLKWKLLWILSINKTYLSWKELLLYSSFSQWPSPSRPSLPITKPTSTMILGLTLTLRAILAGANITSCIQGAWMTALLLEESPFQLTFPEESPHAELPPPSRTRPAAGPPPKLMPSSLNGMNEQHDSTKISYKIIFINLVGNSIFIFIIINWKNKSNDNHINDYIITLLVY